MGSDLVFHNCDVLWWSCSYHRATVWRGPDQERRGLGSLFRGVVTSGKPLLTSIPALLLCPSVCHALIWESDKIPSPPPHLCLSFGTVSDLVPPNHLTSLSIIANTTLLPRAALKWVCTQGTMFGVKRLSSNVVVCYLGPPGSLP